MIGFICPGCGHKLSVKDEFAGKNGICPRCKQRVHVPAASTDPVSSKKLATPVNEPTVAAPPPTPDGAETVPPSGMRAVPSAEDATVPPSEKLPSLPHSGGERLDFLSPPQGPGELGRLGSYRVLKVLGAGGMGMVLLSEDPLLKRSVALKVMRPELAAQADARQRFLREAQATAAIEHPHIVHLYQVGEDRGVPFLAMPFLKGQPLDERLKRQKKLPAAEVISLGRQIAEGLAAAHKHGLIHRDIKPANLWLEPTDQGGSWVKILDFGLARAVSGDDGQLTKTGAIMGTPAYMAPEQARGEKVDGRCDLFSLGGVLYRMLTGEMPFKGSDTISLLMALATAEPRPVAELVPDAPPELADLVQRLLAKDPAKRPASARAVADALAEMEQDRTQTLPAPAAPASAKQRQKPKPRWLLPAAGGGVLLALLVLGLIVFGRRSGAEKASIEPPEPPPGAEKVITNSIGMKLMPIAPGTFWMGSPRAEEGRHDDEHQHEVVLTKPFFIGVHEVTVGQFAAFVKDTSYQTEAEKTGEGSYTLSPSGDGKQEWKMDAKATWKNPGFAQTDDHPVVCVSWHDAAAFTHWLTIKESKSYGLPTEAQWEYCCRAGARTKFAFGDDKAKGGEYAWYDASAAGASHPVGQKKPNAWGLFDMHGNAGEWCSNWYDKDYYTNSRREDPVGPRADRNRALRGGGWRNPLWRAALRLSNSSTYRAAALGFRVVMLPDVYHTDSLGMKLRRINPGGFTMGSPAKEPGRAKDEEQHPVSLTKPFSIGLYQVTVGQFAAFVKESGYQTDGEKAGAGAMRFVGGKWVLDPQTTWRNPGFAQTDDLPVVCVSWYDAMAFCKWLSKKEGKRYALPSEAQWELSCRARSRGMFSFGDDDAVLSKYAWHRGNAQERTHPVGQLKPNAWGLYDMHGNVWQWCSDWYAADAYWTNPREDPRGPPAGTQRVTRGGSWMVAPGTCRAASRGRSNPELRNSNVGFRVVILPEEVVTNSLGMKLKLIGAGKFTMGSPPHEPGRGKDEDEHEVAITRPFYMGVHKVTVGQFAAFIKEAGYKTDVEKNGQGASRRLPDGKWKREPATTWRHPAFPQADDHPVVCVTWKDAKAFCEWLSKKEGKRYILPTEAQWEYCCRAGTRSRFFFGDDERKLGEYAWHGGNSQMRTHPVGQLKPNPWGLYDMHGNAQEATGDWYAADYYKKSPKDAPPGPVEGAKVVMRGGGWLHPSGTYGSARRYAYATPASADTNTGFRVALLY